MDLKSVCLDLAELSLVFFSERRPFTGYIFQMSLMGAA